VFYLAVLPQFIPASVPRGAAHLAAGVALTLVHVVEGATWFAVLVGGVVFATRLAVDDR
jgi:threonine/homoserine/homoserine lactone efflux protein